jgi:mutator protein MutT
MKYSKIVRVVAAVIQEDGRYLLAKRPFEKRHGGLWEFPGGKIHEGESEMEAVNRELFEEMEIKVTQLGRKLWQSIDPGSNFLIEFHEVEIKGKPNPLEHQDVQWVTIKELMRFELAPTDAQFVREYLVGGFTDAF